MSKAITNDLTMLATEINAEHILCLQAMRSSLEHAVRVGELLNTAKELVNHGDWLPWVGTNCEFSERTARAYMRVTRNWPELSKTATTADLTLSGALKLLQEPKDFPSLPDVFEGMAQEGLDAYLAEMHERLDKADTIQEALKIESALGRLSLYQRKRYIKSAWEFGKVLNEIEGSDEISQEKFDEMIDAMGADRRHVKRVKLLATIPGGQIYQYFSEAEEKTESSNGDYELTLQQVLWDLLR